MKLFIVGIRSRSCCCCCCRLLLLLLLVVCDCLSCIIRLPGRVVALRRLLVTTMVTVVVLVVAILILIANTCSALTVIVIVRIILEVVVVGRCSHHDARRRLLIDDTFNVRLCHFAGFLRRTRDSDYPYVLSWRRMRRYIDACICFALKLFYHASPSSYAKSHVFVWYGDF